MAALPPRAAPGPALSTMRRLQLPGPVRAIVVRIDPSTASVEAVPARPRAGGYSTLRRVAERSSASLAVNGDLSRLGWPAHLLLRAGSILTSGGAAGGAIAIDATGTRATLRVDRPTVRLTRLDTGDRIGVARWNAGEAPGRRLAVFGAGAAPLTDHPSICAAGLRAVGGSGTRVYRVEASGCGLDVEARDGAFIAVAPRSSPAGAWLRGLAAGVRLAVTVDTGLPHTTTAFGGMPVLVRRGRVVDAACGPLTCALHPRTAVGITRGCLDEVVVTRCRLVIVVVDGRRPSWSVGMTTDRLARLMRRLGAVEAVNLDGGASTQLIVHGRTLNRPAPGARRAVVSAVIVGAMRNGRRERP